MPRQTSLQLTEATERQVEYLKQRGFGTFTDINRIAIDRMYREEQGVMEVTIKNYRRSRRFGWGWTTEPTGEDAYSIKTPSSPDYEGTLNQLAKARANDAAFNNLGGAFYNMAWFYDGHRITHTWTFTRISDIPEDGDLSKLTPEDYGYAWVSGFEPPDDEPDVTIRLEAERSEA